ncbi:MAG: VWA domain-containing protein [Planctomycetota bacterium]
MIERTLGGLLLVAACASAQVQVRVIGSGPVPERRPLRGDVVVVLDVSESMSLPGRWARAEALLREVRARADDDARLALIGFAGDSRPAWKGWLRAPKLTPARLARALRELRPRAIDPLQELDASHLRALTSCPWDAIHRALAQPPDHLIAISDFHEVYGLGNQVVQGDGGMRALARACARGTAVELHVVQDDTLDVLSWTRSTSYPENLARSVAGDSGAQVFAWPPTVGEQEQRYQELGRQTPTLALEALDGAPLPSGALPESRFRVRIEDPWFSSGLPYSREEHARPSLVLSVEGPDGPAITPPLTRRGDALVAELKVLREPRTRRFTNVEGRLAAAPGPAQTATGRWSGSPRSCAGRCAKRKCAVLVVSTETTC